eukprot:CAMPEP_0201122082 /NCGR_PEP_ID=MMETSP0850-20130426/5804_1 /ASSEMBLY_ACC=CAM_ASM_000622 /TAXON_ID=183588 /ORGANISM="Pseudo-nitzschia fraudulenta, Strain WWA7" /LENGTH=53 /DNA_ID=CAMNT_0047388681 /DNA_START=82 /DNA_END=243 /DNA_ORIENTATION=+
MVPDVDDNTPGPFLLNWELWYVVVPIRKERWYTDRGMLSVLLAESAGSFGKHG